MCGLTVIISTQINPAQMMRMNDAISHRGPDDEGYVFFCEENSICVGGRDTPAAVYDQQVSCKPDGLIEHIDLSEKCNIAFGHRRLSIVDLSSLGHQPMCDLYRRYWITYNGEIYNHVEIRTELEALGHKFFSHSDTEVILEAYREWGEDCLSRFNGMWAFAIYDQQEDLLFLSRDRFGVKPLYYWVSPQGELAFVSEIKQFTVMNGWRAKINPQRAYDFLAWGLTDHTDETLFDRVYQIPPGCSISLKIGDYTDSIATDGRLPIKRWYQLIPEEFSGDFDTAVDEMLKHLTNAVTLRLRADVSVGSCLSGGLDSSSIVCLMNRLLIENDSSNKQKTFSACSNINQFDERKWIDQVVNAAQVEAHYVYPEFEQLFDKISEITWHQDEPFGSTSVYAQWSVFSEARKNDVKVMLDGQGADEQLAGYHNFFSPRLGGLFKRIKWMSLISEMRAMHMIHGYSMLTVLSYLGNAILPEFIRDFLRRKAGKTNSSPEWLNVDKLKCVTKNPRLALGEAGGDCIRQLSIAQLTASNLQMLLHWEDRDSMAHSIESRVPFLDYRLIEFVIGLPDEFKLSAGITKRVLRSSMREILPESICNRMDKLGFVTAEEVWIKDLATNLFRDKLKSAIDKTNGVIEDSALDLFDQIVDGKQAFSHTPWRLISFGEWVERFEVSLG